MTFNYNNFLLPYTFFYTIDYFFVKSYKIPDKNFSLFMMLTFVNDFI